MDNMVIYMITKTLNMVIVISAASIKYLCIYLFILKFILLKKIIAPNSDSVIEES